MRTRLFMLLALVVMSGCSQTPTNDPHSPITLTIKAEEQIIQSKPTIVVICEVKNVSDQPREIMSVHFQQYMFSWYVNGRIISRRYGPATDGEKKLMLKPQEIARYKESLEEEGWGYFKTTFSGNIRVSDLPVFQPKKEYRVRAALPPFHSLTGKEIWSNEIKVRIP